MIKILKHVHATAALLFIIIQITQKQTINLMYLPLVSAKSIKAVSGMSDVIRPACPNGPPTYEEAQARVQYGDKVKVKLSAYAENPHDRKQPQKYSPEIAEQEIVIGRANIPVLNEHLQGMCKNELRRVITWVNPKMKAGPLAYMVELTDIVEKRLIQEEKVNESDLIGLDEL